MSKNFNDKEFKFLKTLKVLNKMLYCHRTVKNSLSAFTTVLLVRVVHINKND